MENNQNKLNIRTEAEEIERIIKRLDRVVTKRVQDRFFINIEWMKNAIDFLRDLPVPDSFKKEIEKFYTKDTLKDWMGSDTYKESIRDIISSFEGQLCPCPLNSLTEQEKNTISEINDRIKGRGSYGLRNGKVKERSRIYAWSNGQARWIPYQRVYNEGDVVRLDANEILVPDIFDRERAWDIACCFEDLPLYAYSFESRERNPETSEEMHQKWFELMKDLVEAEEFVKQGFKKIEIE